MELLGQAVSIDFSQYLSIGYIMTRSLIYLFAILRRFQHCTGHMVTVLWAEETSTYSWSRFCNVNC